MEENRYPAHRTDLIEGSINRVEEEEEGEEEGKKEGEKEGLGILFADEVCQSGLMV